MYIHVKVLVNQKKESLSQIDENHFEISVKEKAERNLANTRVLKLIKYHFEATQKTPIKRVKIVNGHHSRSKLLSVEI